MNPLTERQRARVAQWVPLVRRKAREATVGQRADIEDAIGDAMLEACRSGKKYRKAHGVTFGSYVGANATFAALISYRRRVARGFTGLRTGGQSTTEAAALVPRVFEVSPSDVAPDADDEPIQPRILAALDGLNPTVCRAVVWAVVENIDTAEIAAREGVCVETVRRWVKRGLGELRERLEHGCGE